MHRCFRRKQHILATKTREVVALLALCAAVAPACDERDDLQEDESLGVVVEADRRLAAEETGLLTRRGSLQRRRSSVRDKRAALLSRKLALGDQDPSAKEAIEQEETELVRLEAKLVQQELKLNKKLNNLLQRKSGLVAKLGKGGDQTKAWLFARREHSVAQRERDIARREGELGAREKTLAQREQAFSVRQAKICPTGSTTVVQAPASGGSAAKSYRRRDVEPLYRKALEMMRKRGILTVDLPPGVDGLVTETRHAVSRGDYDRAKYSVDQLMAAVRATKIDRSFIGAKIDRLARAIRRAPPKGAKKTKVERLFQQATANYGDGQFSAANRKLNQIYALVR